MISGVGKVVVPVDDEERAKQLWTTRVGFATPPRQQHFSWWTLFEDHDGTGFALGEWE